MALTNEQRVGVERDLLAQMDSLKQKMDALGIAPKAASNPVAPDGGPSSGAHRFLKTQLKPMIVVMVAGEGGVSEEVQIREEWFNPAVHTRVQKARERREIKTPVAPKLKLSMLTRDELLTMTTPALMELPEVALVGEPPTSKGALVEAILGVRAAQIESVA